MLPRTPFGRWFLLALALGAAAGAPACSEDLRVDLGAFCLERPDDVDCPRKGAAGALAGSAGRSDVAGMGGAGASTGGAGAGGAGTGGSALSCTLPEVACNGACAFVPGDPRNCGECGYVCEGGAACTGGACAAAEVVSNVVAPYALALDTTSLYFSTPVKLDAGSSTLPSAVRKVPRAGGSAPTAVFPATFLRSRTLVLRENTLFFADLDGGGHVVQGLTDGRALPQNHVNEAQPGVLHLVAADGQIWWSSFAGTSHVRRAPAAPTPAPAPTNVTPATPQAGQAISLAVEGAGQQAVAYWVNRGAGTAQQDTGLWRRQISALGPERLAIGGAPLDLALVTDGIYVADANAGIRKAQKTGTNQTLTPVISPANLGGALQGFAVASGKLYWLSFENGQLALHRSALDGSAQRVLGRALVKSSSYWANPIGPSRLLVDGGFVYFSDPGTVTGDTQNGSLEGVIGKDDGVIYRLPQ
ncbi:MAG: hypothetical protein MUF34_37435 [Polyangiaceae bacterium]|jgi:hypothetical protein|nr:hypothetical protein [Polyangiaceae bacterium]